MIRRHLFLSGDDAGGSPIHSHQGFCQPGQPGRKRQKTRHAGARVLSASEKARGHCQVLRYYSWRGRGSWVPGPLILYHLDQSPQTGLHPMDTTMRTVFGPPFKPEGQGTTGEALHGADDHATEGGVCCPFCAKTQRRPRVYQVLPWLSQCHSVCDNHGAEHPHSAPRCAVECESAGSSSLSSYLQYASLQIIGDPQVRGSPLYGPQQVAKGVRHMYDLFLLIGSWVPLLQSVSRTQSEEGGSATPQQVPGSQLKSAKY